MRAPDDGVIVRCRGLRRAFDDGVDRRVVLDDLSLEVRASELLVVMGASGSGKSTLLSAVGGLDRAYEGALELFGHAVRSMTDRELSRLRGRTIGFVFQSFHLLPHLSALENVLLPSLFGPPLEAPERRAREALARVGLADRGRDRPSSLSGGQRQRVAIARALLLQPPLVLCDEPTGNLDVDTGGQIIDLFRTLHAQGDVTFVVATHDARIAQAATRVLQLTGGRLEATP